MNTGCIGFLHEGNKVSQCESARYFHKMLWKMIPLPINAYHFYLGLIPKFEEHLHWSYGGTVHQTTCTDNHQCITFKRKMFLFPNTFSQSLCSLTKYLEVLIYRRKASNYFHCHTGFWNNYFRAKILMDYSQAYFFHQYILNKLMKINSTDISHTEFIMNDIGVI